MSKAIAEASAVIDASASAIYAVLKDYENGHPNIVPKKYFAKVEVEFGGQGAGTIVRVVTKAMGVEKSYRMEVREPEPGRVLTETDLASGLVTAFTLTPLDGVARTDVRISSEWTPRRGIFGAVEKFVTALMMRRIYAAELQNLAAFMRSRPASS